MKNAEIKAKMKRFWKKGSKNFCRVFLNKNNLERDIIITIAVAIFSAMVVANGRFSLINIWASKVEWETKVAEKIRKKEKSFIDNNFAIIDLIKKINWKKEDTKETEEALSEKQIYQEIKSIQEMIDISKWKTHQSQWYGFEIKYPEKWLNPVNQTASRASKWEYRYQFRKNILEENNPYTGFDVVIYNLKKVRGLAETDEFPPIKNEDLEKEGKCETIEGHLIETGDYPAEEIYIAPADDCHNSTLFFSFTRGEYVYNLIPITKAGFEMTGDPRVEIVDNFSDFFAAVATLNTIDIVRPKPVIAPRINAPFPVIFKRSNGRLVCSNKNDHPSKSNKNKGKHLDMECCLDPDEYPNPHCYYPSDKYGKYLK